jgi:signal transduction histidine kinase
MGIYWWLMMNKIIFLILISLINLFAIEAFDISKLSFNKQAISNIYCVEDKNGSLSFDTILNKNDLQKITKSNLGYNLNTHWCKLKLTNSSNEKLDYIYYNPRTGVDFIDVRIYKDNTIKDIQLGDMRPLENRELQSIVSNFKLTVEPNETVTIITKYQTAGNIEVSWIISNVNEFISSESTNFTFIFLYLGFMLAIMFAKLFNYYYIKDKIYIVYAVFVFSAIASAISNYGVMHYYFYDYFDPFTLTITASIFSHVFLASLWIFTLMFFHINKKSKLYYLFIFVITYNILVTLLYLYSYIDITVLAFTPLALLVALIESLLLLVISFVMFIKKKPGSMLFLIAHVIYIGSILYFILNLSGVALDSIKSMHISSLGIFFATYFMSLSLSSRFKVLKDAHDKVVLEIEKNKQFTLIGTTISYVTHQWKQPLSILASRVSKIDAMIEHKPHVQIGELKDEVNNMQKNIQFIDNTLKDIKALFKINTSDKVQFNIKETITTLKDDFDNSLKNDHIKISIDVEDTILCNGNENLFIHAIKNILQNSIDAMIEKKIVDGHIVIKSSSKENVLLSIEDNAGGIDKKIVENIFEKTNSNKKDGMGIGLSITKDIIEKEFQSQIIVIQTDHGTKFIIEEIN